MEDERDVQEAIITLSEKVAPLYKLLNWTWHDGSIPSARKIRETLRELYTDLKPRDSEECATGGLYVKREDGVIEVGMEISEIACPEDE